MTEPTEHDVSPYHRTRAGALGEDRAGRIWPKLFDPEQFNEQAVRETVRSDRLSRRAAALRPGPVEQTIPGAVPDRLALLRLDTDWYESTRHELLHLYPRLADGGVLIIDDYGHWEGARRAVDEYFAEHAPPVLLSRIDYTARIAVKH